MRFPGGDKIVLQTTSKSSTERGNTMKNTNITSIIRAKKSIVATIMTLVMIIMTGVSPVYAATKRGGSARMDEATRLAMISEAFQLANAQRQAAGLMPLTWDEGLANATNTRASELVVCYSHTRPDGSVCFTAFPAHCAAGENIQMGNANSVKTASGAITNWMNSPGHRANILNPSFTKGAISVVQIGGNYYWAQCFIG